MPKLYAEVLRSVAFRDNNAKPQGDNNPATSNTSWFADSGFGGTKNSDGDFLKVTGTDATHGVYRNFTGNPSTTTYPYVVVRAYADSAQTIQVQVNELSGLSDSFTISLTSSPTTFSLKTTSGRQYSATQTVRILNQSGGGTLYIDYVYGCGQPPVQLSQRDLSSGTIIRTALGADTAQLTVNNWRGKFVAGSSSSIALSFGDHLHIYLGQGPTALHVFGGYVEQQDAVMPPDRMIISGRGFGIALLRAKMLNSYSNQTPRQIINDVVDNQVNASNKNGLGIASNYHLTRSYVQDLGSSIPLYLANMLPAYNVLREICDLTVSQGSPSIFFVDPAENLHFVPLGSQGSANWSTDPFIATYPGTLAIGKNLSVVQVPRDTMSVVNRVHYYAISQTPGL